MDVNAYTTTAEYLPRQVCFAHDWPLLVLHGGSNLATGLAYMMISGTLLYVAYKRGAHFFNWILIAFGSFIFFCGIGHFADVLAIWWPAYWLFGWFKLLTALDSIVVAGLLLYLVPRLISFPRASSLRATALWLGMRARQIVETPHRDPRAEQEAAARLREAERLMTDVEGFLSTTTTRPARPLPTTEGP